MTQDLDIYVHPRSYCGLNTSIGYGTNINGPAYIGSRMDAAVKIGKYCAIAHGLRIRTRNHYTGYPNIQDKFQNRYHFPVLDVVKGPVVIGNNVWIADNVLVLPGVTIGDGAVIGGGSVVTRDIEPFSIAVGNPARVIKKRFSDAIIEQLLTIQWWEWSDEKIRRNRRFFETDLSQHPECNLNELIVD